MVSDGSDIKPMEDETEDRSLETAENEALGANQASQAAQEEATESNQLETPPHPAISDEGGPSQNAVDQAAHVSRLSTSAIVAAVTLLTALVIGGWVIVPRMLEARKDYQEGRRLLDDQEYALARDAFRRSAETLPTYASTSSAAMLFLRDGNFQDAERFLETASLLRPSARETRLLQARLSLFKYFLLNLHTDNQKLSHSRLMEDVLLTNLGVELKENYPDESAFIHNTPTALRSSAEYLLNDLLEENPLDAEVLSLLGALKLYDSNHAEAREYFEQTRDLNPKFPALEWAFAEIENPWSPSGDSAGETDTGAGPEEEEGNLDFESGGIPAEGLDDLRDMPPADDQEQDLSGERLKLPIPEEKIMDYEAGDESLLPDEFESSNALSENLEGDSNAFQALAEERNRRMENGILYRFRPVSYHQAPEGAEGPPGFVKVADILGEGGSVIPIGGSRTFEKLGIRVTVSGDDSELVVTENGNEHRWVRLRSGWYADWEAKILKSNH
jgi:tetratricopeptide (TPR) repeat protein